MPSAYLLGRYSDKMLGLFTGESPLQSVHHRLGLCTDIHPTTLHYHIHTGGLAYHLHENNPRSRPPPGHTLRELAGWHWEQHRDARTAREAELLKAEETDIKAKEELEILRREMAGLVEPGVKSR